MANYNCVPVNDLAGKRFGRLSVLDYAGTSTWRCRCDCGAIIAVKTYSLNSDRTRSCGCLRRESSAQRATKHNGATDPLYHVLNVMHQRCENPNNKDFKWYGAMGVKVCAEWTLTNYPAFRNWALANGYRPGLTIDRENPDGDYSPDNCRWITIQEQQRNRRNSKPRKD